MLSGKRKRCADDSGRAGSVPGTPRPADGWRLSILCLGSSILRQMNCAWPMRCVRRIVLRLWPVGDQDPPEVFVILQDDGVGEQVRLCDQFEYCFALTVGDFNDELSARAK